MFENINLIESASSVLLVVTLLLIAAVIGYWICLLVKEKELVIFREELREHGDRLHYLETHCVHCAHSKKDALKEEFQEAAEVPSGEFDEGDLTEHYVELDDRGIPVSKITHLLSFANNDTDWGEHNKDDLQVIKGIGPIIEEKLNALGLFSFEQISRLNQRDIQLITKTIEFFPGRIERDEWVLQAKNLLKNS